ncbi:hypothetical protein SASPL_101545 [Salvia splendens]|uniref:Chitin-binding type-1 domain-containing protein n=1 Tax=Salvia splendens TaxID=180675 RepID=A0A8X8YPG7_SALSN|nr:chitinase 6-like [Salvia splendens]KAG6436643.1 hypothetical protein SASPL_101545 [Salvia splendens]
MKNLLTLFILLLAAGKWVSAQNCGCKPHECCSKYGYCGVGDDYCGGDCQSGPCKGRNGVKFGDIVTDNFFNGIIASQGRRNCPGKGFYIRSRFVDAAASQPSFGAIGSADDSKREIAAFFAHVAHESGRMCFIEEEGGKSRSYCDNRKKDWPCAANRRYYGRGPLQLTWNFNYGAAGQAVGFDGLRNPEILAENPSISIKAAVWFWMENCHAAFVSGNGFGATIRGINSIECDGRSPAQVSSRVDYYKEYCKQLRVDPGPNLRC